MKLAMSDSSTESARIARERETIHVMILMYCRDHHGPQSSDLCPDCAALDGYAMKRLERCPFKTTKPTCVRCTVHCWRPEERERIRVVMRYAGPRMLMRHPILAFFHLIDGRRTAAK